MHNLIFLVLHIEISKLVVQKVKYLSENEEVLNPEFIPNQRMFFIVYKWDDQKHKIKCTNNLYNSTKGIIFKQSICFYSLELEGYDDSHGSLNVCDSIKGIVETKDKIIEIAQTSNDINYLDIDVKDIKEKDISKKVNFLQDEISESRDSLVEKDISTEKLLKKGRKDRQKDKKKKEDKINYLKIFIVNDSDRVLELGKNVNDDTYEIVLNVNNILETNKLNIRVSLMGVLNIMNESIFGSDFRAKILVKTFFNEYLLGGKESLVDYEKYIADKERKLEYFSNLMNDFKNVNKTSPLSNSNLIVLLTSKDVDSIEGLSYIGGIYDRDGGYSKVNLSKNDSNFYKGKVLLHEILHSIGANHDDLLDNIMRITFNPLKKEEDLKISEKTIKLIKKNISENRDIFKHKSTCGNGFVDEFKECDSGLPYGSECCSGECKLIKKYTCDDRNGECCKKCQLVDAENECKSSNDNFYTSSCQNKGKCNGKIARCIVEHKKDHDKCGNDGYCLKGMCQTRSLFCRRLDRKYEPMCPKDKDNLVCLDKNNICSTVFDPSYAPISVFKFS